MKKIFSVNYEQYAHYFTVVESKASTSADYVEVGEDEFNDFLEDWAKDFNGKHKISGDFTGGWAAIEYEDE